MDWMSAMTSGATCHYLLQLRYYSATRLENKTVKSPTWLCRRVNLFNVGGTGDIRVL